MQKVSIITVSFNSANRLRSTLESVKNNDYSDLEYILIDGQSNDGTQKLIDEYIPYIDYWVSEPDRGIYHAMNKGIERSTGKWLLFLNAGDQLAGAEVLSNIFRNNYIEFSLIYGHTKGNGKVRKSRDINKVKSGRLMASHQAMFFNKELLEKELYYDERLKYCADAELVIRIFAKGYKFLHINMVFTDVEKGNRFVAKHGYSLFDRYLKLSYIYGHLGVSGIYRHLTSAVKLKLDI